MVNLQYHYKSIHPIFHFILSYYHLSPGKRSQCPRLAQCRSALAALACAATAWEGWELPQFRQFRRLQKLCLRLKISCLLHPTLPPSPHTHRGTFKETYERESNADNDHSNLYFIHHLRALHSWMLQLQLSLSNEMTNQMLFGPISKKGVCCSFS